MKNLSSNPQHKSPRNLIPIGILALGLALAASFLYAASVMTAAAQAPAGTEEVSVSNLEVDVDALAQFIRPGQALTYTVRYTNTTGNSIANVTIDDALSPGQFFNGTYAANPAIPPQNFSQTGPLDMAWFLPSLGANASGIITFSVVVTTTYQPDINDSIILVGNSAEMQTSTPGITTGDDADAATVTGPLLVLDKTASATDILPGHWLTYTLTLENALRTDTIPANTIVISDDLPANTSFLSASAGGTYNAVADAVVWNFPGPLAPGDETTFAFTVVVDPDTTANNIKNNKNDYHARAQEMLVNRVNGESTVTVDLLLLLDKTATGTHTASGNPASWQGELVTYTLTINNPLNTQLTGVIVTDTLPGAADPFIYLNPAFGSPPPDNISPDGRNLGWVVTLPPWGSVTRSFVAQVPGQTYIDDNKTSTDYLNTLGAVHPSITFPLQNNLAKFRVEAVLTMDKDVTPTHGQPGTLVTYTIELINDSPYDVNDIVLTDTMQGSLFSFDSMVSGPNPLPGFDDNPIVWSGIDVPAGTTMEIIFRASIDGTWLATYKNDLSAASAVYYIPPRTNQAGVKIDSPITLGKTVSPTTVFRGDIFEYEITIGNPTSSIWVISKIEDFLPTGFVQVGGSNPGGNPARTIFSPNLNIAPFGSWTGSLNIQVGNSVSCSPLPQTYKNDAGDIAVTVVSPVSLVAYNATDLAPVQVLPHIETALTTYRTDVLPGDFVTYTLTLDNVSPVFANDQDFSLLIPSEFTYISIVSGPAPSVAANLLTWNNVDIPGNATVQISFKVQVSLAATFGNKDSVFTAVDQPPICFEELGNSEGRVKVHDPAIGVIILTKTPKEEQVPAGGLVEYSVKFNNQDSYPFFLTAITDTMPTGFTFDSMISGPAPTVQGSLLIWQNFNLPAGNTTWKFQLKAAVLFGNYYNNFDAYTPETIIHAVDSDPVTVLPLLDVTKEVSVSTIPAGNTVIYTITLVNISADPYAGINITDTLPAGFTFVQAVPGYPVPNSVGAGNSQPVWNNLSIATGCGGTGCEVVLAFYAYIDFSVTPGTYYNAVSGYSAEVFIPDIMATAPVTVTVSTVVPYLWLPIVIRE